MPPVANKGSGLPRRVAEVLRHAPAGLISDIDGTLSPIVADPAQARVLPGAKRALRALRDRLALVGLVTGRPAAVARQMVGVARVAYVGNHGLEVLRDGHTQVAPEAEPWLPRLRAALEEVRPGLDLPGIVVEDKRASASIHYRRTAEPERARERILAAIQRSPTARAFRVEEGRMVINLLPPVEVSKGTAVARLARERGLRGLVYLGDDVTDAHAFRALRRLRDEGLRTLCIGVVGSETPAEVRELADAHVASVEAVVELLTAVGTGLRTE